MSVQNFYETVHILVEKDDYPAWETLPLEELQRWTRMARLGGVVLSPQEIENAWGPQPTKSLTLEQVATELEKYAIALRALKDD